MLKSYWTRWSVIVVAGWLLITFFTAKTYRQDRFVHVRQLAPGVYAALDDRAFRGENTVVGWPARFVGWRREATELDGNSPWRLTAVKTSAMALALNLLVVGATIVAGVQVSRLLRHEVSKQRLAIVVVCLAIWIVAAFAAGHNFLGRIPVYADDATAWP